MPWPAGRRTSQGDRARAAIIRFVVSHTAELGYAPSIPKIAAALGRSRSGTWAQVQVLLASGVLRYTPGAPCSLRLAAPAGGRVVPVRWCAECGQEMPADHDHHVSIPEFDPERIERTN